MEKTLAGFSTCEEPRTRGRACVRRTNYEDVRVATDGDAVLVLHVAAAPADEAQQ